MKTRFSTAFSSVISYSEVNKYTTVRSINDTVFQSFLCCIVMNGRKLNGGCLWIDNHVNYVQYHSNITGSRGIANTQRAIVEAWTTVSRWEQRDVQSHCANCWSVQWITKTFRRIRRWREAERGAQIHSSVITGKLEWQRTSSRKMPKMHWHWRLSVIFRGLESSVAQHSTVTHTIPPPAPAYWGGLCA